MSDIDENLHEHLGQVASQSQVVNWIYMQSDLVDYEVRLHASMMELDKLIHGECRISFEDCWPVKKDD